MLVCEATIFAMSILLVEYNMTASLEAYNDMEVYTVMCSMSTFAGLMITILLIAVPGKVGLVSARVHVRLVHGTALHAVLQLTQSLTLDACAQVWRQLETDGLGVVVKVLINTYTALGATVDKTIVPAHRQTTVWPCSSSVACADVQSKGKGERKLESDACYVVPVSCSLDESTELQDDTCEKG